LPRWISEELARVTPKAKLAEAGERLLAAAQSFAAGRHGKAVRHAEVAKELSPRDATVREVLGLAAYRMGRWDVALRELRTFRRLTGETTHLPVEIDVLRALERPDDVERAWQLMQRLGGDRSTRDEAKVVYGSFLLDRDEPRRAWEVANPKRIGADPRDSEVRVWYVAARAAARLGDAATARQLFEAIQDADPAMPGMDDLDRLISEAG
jgi:tetratricopeptide (TPR) repeat protein